MPSFAHSRLVVFKVSVLPTAPVWIGGRVALTGSACFLFPGERRERRQKNTFFVSCLFAGEIGNKRGWSWSQMLPEPSGVNGSGEG